MSHELPEEPRNGDSQQENPQLNIVKPFITVYLASRVERTLSCLGLPDVTWATVT